MSFWDKLIQNIPQVQPVQPQFGEAFNLYGRQAASQRPGPNEQGGTAYAATFPLYDVISPQYVTPAPYSLVTQGYKTNEVIFAAIGKRAQAISSAPLWVYDDTGETPEEQHDHPIRQLLRRVCPRVNEKTFWQITEIYLDIAGFAAWEKERNRAGEVIALWPMRPDWCSFYRGEGKPLRAIRYQPYGLPFVDIPEENVLLFQYFDPQYPLLKGWGPTAAALREISVDNSMTDFLALFMQRGAQVSGVLSTTQTIDKAQAQRIRDEWKQQHGGYQNWTDVAVLGNGVSYANNQMSFRDMVFPDLDSRTETRICTVFDTPPIILGTKAGLATATYSNYAEARKAWYEGWVSAQWEFLSGQFTEQMIHEYHPEEEQFNFYCQFMTHRVKALQEDKSLAWQRAIAAANANVATRDEAREEMGLDPIDEEPVWIGPSNAAPVLPEALTEAVKPETIPATPTEAAATKEIVTAQDEDKEQMGSEAERELEAKQFRAFANKRAKEGKESEINGFTWKFTPSWKRVELLAEVGIPADAPFRWQGNEY